MSGEPFATLEHASWAGVAALCFAVLFNVPVRTLAACWLTGFVGYAARTLTAQSFNVATASFVAAFAVSLFGIACGRRMRCPAVVFVIPGVIPLVPGSLAFRTILNAISVLDGSVDAQHFALASAAVGVIRITLITLGLATGVAIPSLVLRKKHPML